MSTPGTVAFHTLGCKLNFAETSGISRLFEEAGYVVVPYEQSADYYVLNTCSVTDFADRKCRKAVRQARQRNTEAKIIVMGCYAQLKPEEIAAIPGVDLVLGAGEKFRILEFLAQLGGTRGQIAVSAVQQLHAFHGAYSYGDRTRTFLKVQDGCDYNCSFCTIPLARGHSRSPSIEEVIQQAREVVDRGIKEIVLTGVNLGDFGKYFQEASSKFQRKTDFLTLLRALDTVDGLERLRISSIEPNLCSDAVIDFVAASEKIVPHFHLPLQSGNDQQLIAMARRYRTQLYRERVHRIKEVMPDCCIGVDILAGFPGEDHEAFLNSYRFVQELDVDYLHVFTYSERPNTLAITLPDPVPMSERRQRSEMLTILSDKKYRSFAQSQVGKIRPVLFEKGYDLSSMSGYTDNYLKVQAPWAPELVNTIQPVRLDGLDHQVTFQVAPVAISSMVPI